MIKTIIKTTALAFYISILSLPSAMAGHKPKEPPPAPPPQPQVYKWCIEKVFDIDNTGNLTANLLRLNIVNQDGITSVVSLL